MIDYSPLWQTLAKKGISQYQFLKMNGINNSLLDKLKHQRNITLLTLEQICKVLDCDISDVVMFIKDE